MSLFMYFMILSILFLISMNMRSHPMIPMILIILYSIMMSFYISLWKINFMYSIMMFMIMISGLLIIFLYFSSLISNEQMTLNPNKLLTLTFLLSFLTFFMNLYYSKNYLFNLLNLSKENAPLMHINEKMFSNILNLYTYPFNNITIICMLFLLMSLFTIIKMSSMKSKPMRKISN
uniref:NADH dehydrogenase subunit 6 n=1 Tax=Dorymyrmex brunneus TaxID=609524 RepID=A0A343YVE5_9HYME|nr:NADH dehydrogenase subunit 6 [Dorymyrmex brunneus]